MDGDLSSLLGLFILKNNYVGSASYPSKMGGVIATYTRHGQIMSERAELKVTSTSYASASSQTSGHGSSQWTTSTASSSSSLQATTMYKYWLRWEDGMEELHHLPFDARIDQKVSFCFAKRLISDPADVPTTLVKKLPMFIVESDISEKLDVIGIMNLDTGKKYSIGKIFVWKRMTKDGSESQGDGKSIFLPIGLGAIFLTWLLSMGISFLLGASVGNNKAVIFCSFLISFAFSTWVMVSTYSKQKKERQRVQECSDEIESIALASFIELGVVNPA